jgi:hypothetical protein
MMRFSATTKNTMPVPRKRKAALLPVVADMVKHGSLLRDVSKWWSLPQEEQEY